MRNSSEAFVQRNAPAALNRLERTFLSGQSALLKRRLEALLSGPLQAPAVVPLGEESNQLLYTLAANGFETGRQHALLEVQRKAARRLNLQQFNQGDAAGGGIGLQPIRAIEWAKRRLVLHGAWQRLLDETVNKILVQALELGSSLRQVQRALRNVFPTFTKSRLENIARTESISAYNAGRVEGFRETGLVDGVQFTAILDARTTNICRKRHGLIMLLSDERLKANTPPLHFQCRSVLIPVDRWDLEDLRSGKGRIAEQFFDWTGDDGPKSLRDALGGWDSAPAPLAGFGGL